MKAPNTKKYVICYTYKKLEENGKSWLQKTSFHQLNNQKGGYYKLLPPIRTKYRKIVTTGHNFSANTATFPIARMKGEPWTEIFPFTTDKVEDVIMSNILETGMVHV